MGIPAELDVPCAVLDDNPPGQAFTDVRGRSMGAETTADLEQLCHLQSHSCQEQGGGARGYRDRPCRVEGTASEGGYFFEEAPPEVFDLTPATAEDMAAISVQASIAQPLTTASTALARFPRGVIGAVRGDPHQPIAPVLWVQM